MVGPALASGEDDSAGKVQFHPIKRPALDYLAQVAQDVVVYLGQGEIPIAVVRVRTPRRAKEPVGMRDFFGDARKRPEVVVRAVHAM